LRMSTSILVLTVLAELWGQIPFAESADFPKEQQLSALLATVRIGAAGREGSGAVVGQRGEFVYILTAQHLVMGTKRVEIEVFTKESYPRAKKKYPSAEIVAAMPGIGDIALVRLRTTDDMPGYLKVCPTGKAPSGARIPALTVGCDSGKPPIAMVAKGVEKKVGQRGPGDEKGAFWQVEAKYSGGHSGGPLVDTNGYLLGVCSGTNREKTYFTHLDEIHRFLIGHGFRWLTEEDPKK
jgi:S1-C subfamily serine protease